MNEKPVYFQIVSSMIAGRSGMSESDCTELTSNIIARLKDSSSFRVDFLEMVKTENESQDFYMFN